MKEINRARVEELIHFGANRDIRKLAQWSLKLVVEGKYKKPARILKAAEKMQKLARKSEK